MAHRSSFVSVLLLGHGHYTGFLLPSSYDSLRCPSHYIYIWPIYRWFTYEKWWFSIHTYIHIYMDGWWLSPTPLKNDGVKVSWDDDIPFPIWWEKIHSCSKPPTSIVNLQIFESSASIHHSEWLLTSQSSPQVPATGYPGCPTRRHFQCFFCQWVTIRTLPGVQFGEKNGLADLPSSWFGAARSAQQIMFDRWLHSYTLWKL